MLQTYVGCGLGRGLFAEKGLPVPHLASWKSCFSHAQFLYSHSSFPPVPTLPQSHHVASWCSVIVKIHFQSPAAHGTWAAFLLGS